MNVIHVNNHACMITYGSNTYGEAAEEVGMKKTCMSYFDDAAKKKGIKKI